MEAIDCRTLYERFDTDRNGRLSRNEFISMIEALLVQRDGAYDPAAALTLSGSLVKLASFQPARADASGRTEIGYDEFAEAVRGGLFVDHFSPELIDIVAGGGPASARRRASSDPEADEVTPVQVAPAPFLSQIRQDVFVSLSRSNSRKLASPPPPPLLAGGGAGGIEAEDETDAEPVVSPRSAARRREAQCVTCLGSFPQHELFGGQGNHYPKDCACHAKCCVDCLQAGAKINIRAGRAPECPGRDPETGLACHAPLRKALTAQLFVGECVLCNDPAAPPLGPENALVAVDCALEHAFCKSCLARETRAKLGPHSATVPRCPRFSECRYIFDKAATQRALEDGSCSAADMTALLDAFDGVRLRAALVGAELNKPCPKPGCLGVLAGTRAFYERPEGVRVQCSACHDPFCYNCEKAVHHNRTCAQVREATMNWTRFLQELVQGGKSQGADGEGLGAVDPGAAAAALAAATNALATAAFFKEAIEQGRLKKCPGCKKQIEKIAGCDHMTCGSDASGGNQQAGCGLDFNWSSVPLMSVADYDAEINAARQIPLHINSTDYQIDEKSYSAVEPPRQIACSRCQAPIRGTRFDCTHCASPGREVSLCLNCVQFHLDPAKKTKHAGHVFSLVDPSPPRPAIQITRAELAPDGSLSVYGLQSCAERLTRGEPYVSLGHAWNLPRSHLPDPTTAVVVGVVGLAVRVDVHPDGRVLYADATGLACEHISLDSISFKVAGKGIVHTVSLAAPGACGPAGGGLRDPVIYKASNGVTLVYGHVALLAQPAADRPPLLVEGMLGRTVRLTGVVHNSPVYAASDQYDKERKHVVALKPDAQAPQAHDFADWHVRAVEGQPTQIRLYSMHHQQLLYVADGKDDRRSVFCWRRSRDGHVQNSDIMSKARLEVEEVPGAPGVVRLRSVHHPGRPYIYTTQGEFDKRRRGVKAWCGAAGPNADILAQAQLRVDLTGWGGPLVGPSTLSPQVIANTASGDRPHAHKTLLAVTFRPEPEPSAAGAGGAGGTSADAVAGGADGAGGGVSPASAPLLGVSLNHCVFKALEPVSSGTRLALGAGVSAAAGAKYGGNAKFVVCGEMVYLYGLLHVTDRAPQEAFTYKLVLAVLPEGARPVGAVQLMAIADRGEDDKNLQVVQISVFPNGEVASFCGAGRVALDGLRFKAGASSGELDLSPAVDAQRPPDDTGFIFYGQNDGAAAVPRPPVAPWVRAGLHVGQHCCHLLGSVFKRRLPQNEEEEDEEEEAGPMAGGGAAVAAGRTDGGVWRHGDVICVLPEGARPVAKMVFACLGKACPSPHDYKNGYVPAIPGHHGGFHFDGTPHW